jgi:uncharacterized protein YqhQ
LKHWAEQQHRDSQKKTDPETVAEKPFVTGMIDVGMGMFLFSFVSGMFLGSVIPILHRRGVFTGMDLMMGVHIMRGVFRHLTLLVYLFLDYPRLCFNRRYAIWRIYRLKQAVWRMDEKKR